MLGVLDGHHARQLLRTGALGRLHRRRHVGLHLGLHLKRTGTALEAIQQARRPPCRRGAARRRRRRRRRRRFGVGTVLGGVSEHRRLALGAALAVLLGRGREERGGGVALGEDGREEALAALRLEGLLERAYLGAVLPLRRLGRLLLRVGLRLRLGLGLG